MGSLLVAQIVLIAVFTLATDAYINNFRFKHSNSFKGNVLPFKAKITGSYYVDLLGTPELSYIYDTSFNNTINAKALITSDFPVVCVGKMGKALAAMDDSAHKRLVEKLKDLAKKISVGDTVQVKTLLQSWDTYIPTSDPDYKCEKLILDPAPDTPNAFVFTTTIEFHDYKPVFFIDSMGVGMFSYSRANKLKDIGHASGNPIRYCGGTDYTGDMYTIEPRPKCPIATSEKSRHYGRAMITVYKPNILSYRINVTRCLQRLTHIHTYEDLLGGNVDHWRKTRNVRTTPAHCREWKATLDACRAFRVNAVSENDDYSVSNYVAVPKRCRFQSAKSQNNAITEFFTKPNLKYWYKAGSVESREVRSATLTNGFGEISMPTATMVTPWLNIPKEVIHKGEYEYNNVTTVWEPFGDDKYCMYTERFRGEVAYIKYKHGDYDVPIDPSSTDEPYTLFLVADQYGALFNADSSQIIKNTSSFNCMPHKGDYRTTLYQMGGDSIISVTVVDEGHENKHYTSHVPDDVAHVGTDEQPHEAFSSVHYDTGTGKVIGVQHHNENTAGRSESSGDGVHDLSKRFNSLKKTQKPGSTDPVTPPAPDPTAMDVIRYIQYKRAEDQKHNLHIRALQSCFTNQLNWDAYTQLLDLNPSRAISNRLNLAVEASLGGNGFYNVKRCELALNVAVVPTLRTSSDERLTVNGEQFTVKEITKHLGVIPDVEKCFSMPLLIFTSPLTGTQVVGQLTLEGVINTQKMSYLEACSRNKAFIFLINDFGHFFFDYAKNFTETAERIRNSTERFLKASTPRIQLTDKTPLDQRTKMHIEHELSKIHILSIVQPSNLKEKEYAHYPTGLFSNDIYSLAEHQSVSLGLMKLMEEQNFERFSSQQFAEDWNRDRPSTDTGLFFGSGSFSPGDFFLKVTEGGGALLHGLGSGAGQLLKGAGEGAGSASKGFFSGIGNALKGGIFALAMPLIAVAVLAVVGVIIYKRMTGKKDHSPTVYEHEGLYDENLTQGYDYERQNQNVNKRNGFSFK